jgi:hypothetical protein
MSSLGDWARPRAPLIVTLLILLIAMALLITVKLLL